MKMRVVRKETGSGGAWKSVNSLWSVGRSVGRSVGQSVSQSEIAVVCLCVCVCVCSRARAHKYSQIMCVRASFRRAK
jgi:hypothetical protein